jgi:penicillin-binding protein 2
MASTPGYDPNGFVTGLTPAQYHALVANPHAPLINHAALGQYPLGSIFKIVTMGAALEGGGYTAATPIAGPPVWYAPRSTIAMHDWNPAGHGVISLREALVQSCDTCFYQIGLHLDQINHDLLPDYVRGWGLGAPTGMVGVDEAAGLIPDPHWTLTTLGKPWVPGNAINMAIGQGYVEVTPLQVAQMLAALGDNGVMHRPYVVQRITTANGAVLRTVPPVVTRRLPLSSAHRRDILQAMLGVTTEAQGTATDTFAGFRWPVAGKTGTAQADSGAPHAWFAALAPADHPRIALVVLVEHGGEGAQVAAPIARQLLQTFFTQDRDLAGTASPGGATVLPVP